MSDNKQKLQETAKTLNEVAVFADYLEVLALGANENGKAERLHEQAEDLRQWAGLYQQAGDSA